MLISFPEVGVPGWGCCWLTFPRKKSRCSRCSRCSWSRMTRKMKRERPCVVGVQGVPVPEKGPSGRMRDAVYHGMDA